MPSYGRFSVFSTIRENMIFLKMFEIDWYQNFKNLMSDSGVISCETFVKHSKG
jgi:hypothetical protein